MGPESDHPAWEGHRGGGSAGVVLSCPPLDVQELCYITLLQEVTVNAFERSLQSFKGMRDLAAGKDLWGKFCSLIQTMAAKPIEFFGESLQQL